MDGQAARGVFVDGAAGVDEPSAGTRERPYKTLGYTLRTAPAGTRYVFIAQGEYLEHFAWIERPVSLQGGYTGVAGGWTRRKQATVTLKNGDSNGIGVTVRAEARDTSVELAWLDIESRPATGYSAGGASIGLRV